MATNIVPIKMIIGRDICACCGAEGDVWTHGLKMTGEKGRSRWIGVVCDICAFKANRKKNNNIKPGYSEYLKDYDIKDQYDKVNHIYSEGPNQINLTDKFVTPVPQAVDKQEICI